MTQETIALLGFGDIARRLSAHFMDDNVIAVKRSQAEVGHAELVRASCHDQQAMDQLFLRKIDVVVMTFTPETISDEGYRQAYVESVRTVLTAINRASKDNPDQQPRLIIFVSSTSVYGQTDGSWVDEASPTEPSNFSGKRLLEAEKLVKDSGYSHCCVRFSGIYGPGRRRLIEQVIAGQGTPAQPVLYSNRIHADDCAGVLAHLIKRQKNQPIDSVYLATDSEPTPLYDVKQFIAEQLDIDWAGVDNDARMPARMLRSSKRCSNKKIAATGYTFIYPTFKQGYGALLSQ